MLSQGNHRLGDLSGRGFISHGEYGGCSAELRLFADLAGLLPSKGHTHRRPLPGREGTEKEKEFIRASCS